MDCTLVYSMIVGFAEMFRDIQQYRSINIYVDE